jgi:Ca2+-binding RTX toxin-like protein
MSVERLEDRVVLTTKIVTIGDSWASFLADGAPGSITDLAGYNNAFQQVLNARGSGISVYNGGFYGGTAAQHATQLSQITSIINAAGPDVDLVYLSSGGNDFLAGLLAGGWYRGKPAGEVQALFDTVGNNVRTVAEHILAIRPDLQVVIASYDYINLWDFNITSGGDQVRANLGLVRSGNWAIDSIQNADLNAALRDLETRKVSIANSNSRIHHVNMFGLSHSLLGYQGYLSNNVNLPPGVWNDFPVRRNQLGSNGNDPIHLTDAAYAAMVDTVYSQWISPALQTGSLTTSANSISFGQVRAGTSASSQSVTLSNSGGNFSKIKNISFGTASGPFTGGGGGANPLFRDPTLGSDLASVSYGFSPSARGSFNQSVSISSNAGSRSLLLSGSAVGPVASIGGAPTFAVARPGEQPTGSFSVANITSDGPLGPLTNLTITGATFTGPDAGLFELVGFAPGMVLSAGQSQNLTLRFLGSATPRTFNATLVLQTDQGASLGGAGASFNLNLQATVNDGFLFSVGVDPNLSPLQSLSVTGWTGDDAVEFQQIDPTTIRAVITKENGLPVQRTLDFVGITGRVIANGGAGNDRLDAQPLSQTAVLLLGGTGNDTLRGGQQADNIDGGDQDDSITGGLGADIILGGDGTDLIFGDHPLAENLPINSANLGSDTIDGGAGDDTIYGDSDGGEGVADSILGNTGNDTIIGDGSQGRPTASDTIRGGSGNDLLKGDADGAEGAPDLLYGDDGNDTIDGGGGNDQIEGGNDDDLLLGGDGAEGANDTLLGGAGRDILVGDRGVLSPKNSQGGADSLDGGTGEDILLSGVLLVSDLAAWNAYQAEWSSNRSYSDRVANLSGSGAGPRANGNFFLQPGSSVLTDFSNPAGPSPDELTGGADRDWFFYGLEDTLIDQAFDESATLIA